MLLTMASGGDSNPFGYSFQHNLDTFRTEDELNAIAAHPVGPPLLDNAETDFINQLFDNPNAFDPSSAFLHPDLQPKNDASHEYNWLYQVPPPTLHSVTSSLGGHNAIRQNRHSLPQPLPPQQPQSYLARHGLMADLNSPDDGVLDAATALFDSATQPARNHLSNESLFLGQGAVMSSLRVRDGVQSDNSTGYYAAPQATTSQTTHTSTQNHSFSHNFELPELEDNPFALFDSSAFSNNADSGNPRLYQFGSDSQFASNGFLPSGPSEDPLSSRVLSKMGEIFQPIPSASNSRPESPAHTRRNTIGTISRPTRPIKAEADSTSGDSEADRAKPGPSKRRKSNKHTRNSSEHVLSTSTATHTSNTQTQRNTKTNSSSHARRQTLANVKSPTKRRKPSPDPAPVIDTSESAQAASNSSSRKPARENLSEEQKRSNHIQSEQKRRNLIKQGFQDLEELVPELRSGGFSKSNMLVETANFLEELIIGNEKLRAAVGEG